LKNLWLLLLPLFCLPDLLLSQQTAVGVLKWTDYLIVPYVLSILAAGGARPTAATRPLVVALTVFCVWCVVSTLTVPLRYGYSDYSFTRVGLAKLAKFALYAAAGIGTMRVASRSTAIQAHLRWSLLVALCIAGVSVYASKILLMDLPTAPHEAGFQYEATNAVSVLMSMLLAFILGEWADRTGYRAWRNAGVVLLPVVVVGFFLTGGRGGWVSLIVAIGYVLLKVGLRPSFVLGALVLALGATLVYSESEDFSRHVDITINPALLQSETEFAQATGFDDGNRLQIFLTQATKLTDAPLLGAGLFHRGSRSGLYQTGSHNFFLQMFLETGVVGGVAILLFFARLWRLSRAGLEGSRSNLGSQAALVAAVVGGLTGEYFYGGPGLLMLMVIVAPALFETDTSPEDAPEQGPFRVRPPARLEPHA
jgi:O-antigen ligase